MKKDVSGKQAYLSWIYSLKDGSETFKVPYQKDKVPHAVRRKIEAGDYLFHFCHQRSLYEQGYYGEPK